MRARKALDTRIATKKSAARVLQRAVRSHIRHPTAQLRLAAGELLDARVAEVRGTRFLHGRYHCFLVLRVATRGILPVPTSAHRLLGVCWVLRRG